ncbi:MAG: PBP1A family penicillin-binding protein [Bacteroides sp.]|nr:PBP1A family penicillin-binding protein [Prevotella sp.]MCM1408656.1 PBP1A family penicillin-binding protein [Treponema brennaborense]MCM1470517.1 PBP1A family penicillin-binding protein [Bacteroides sp.]
MEKIKKRTVVLVFIPMFCAVFMGAALGIMLASTVNTIRTEQFSEFKPALPTRLLDINGELITEFSSDEKREMISINTLPQHMIDALVVREDRVFFNHNGFSFKALFRAVFGRIFGMSLGGGSTLTQQIAGTLYCDRSDISYSRKLKELWWAIQMERRYSKKEILELYLNKIYFGGGTYGVNAASKYYFGHDAAEITPAEAAILVIQLSNPAYYNPFDHPNRAMDRQQAVLNQMVADNYLSSETAEQSFDDYWAGFDYTRISSSAYFMREDKAPWFSEYVLRQLTSMIYGTLDVYTGGFTVNTTMNMKNQLAAQNVMTEKIAYANRSYQSSSGARRSDAATMYIPFTELVSLVFNIPDLKIARQRNETVAVSAFKNEINPLLDVMSLMFNMESLKVGVINRVNANQKIQNTRTTIEGTLISVENDTGYITALVGGSEFNAENQFIRAVQAKIQPGSTFKPLYYSAAIDSRKFTASSIIYDLPTVFYTDDGHAYIPQNFRGEWTGQVQLWYALATSMNVPSIKVLEGVGFDAAIERSAALLGIPAEELPERGFNRVYPLGLGVCSVRPIELARAFAVFANQGREVTPFAIRSVEDRTGKVFLNPEQELRTEQKRKGGAAQIISPQNAYIMTDILMNSARIGTLARGAGWGSRFKYTAKDGRSYTMPAAGKTGTTQNWADAWAVGYTPYITTAVWFGFDRVGQTLGTELTGSTLAGVAWGEYMRIANEDLPYRAFAVPQTGLVQAVVCSVSGQLLTPDCGNNKTTQYFLEGTQPDTMCEFHSNRVQAKALGLERLSVDRYRSGAQGFEFLNESGGALELDLSFLETGSGGSKNTSESKQIPASLSEDADIFSTGADNGIFEMFAVPESREETEPDHNFLLD